MTATRVAAIDCGTNSIRLLIADVSEDSNQLVDVVRRMEIVRLGEGIDRAGEFAAVALERTFAAIDDFAAEIAQHDAGRVRFVATSASRDAANRSVFFNGVQNRLGIVPEVISGADEAALSFAGATREIAASVADPPFLVVDIGGGSTEFVMGDPQSGIDGVASVDVGCVRMAERHFQNDPPFPAEVAAARDDIDAAIKQVALSLPLRRAKTLVGLAGSVTTVAALALGMWEYDPELIHHARITAADVHRVCEELLYSNHEKRAANPAIHPGRLDVIAAGSLILSAIVAYTGVPDILVSEHDILDGIALSCVSD
jgi:exopolyphosphatase/guanosine-5'-triphosphate,3'-diphosphate pyrophosphatase